jgi:hypothetical protein
MEWNRYFVHLKLIRLRRKREELFLSFYQMRRSRIWSRDARVPSYSVFFSDFFSSFAIFSLSVTCSVVFSKIRQLSCLTKLTKCDQLVSGETKLGSCLTKLTKCDQLGSGGGQNWDPVWQIVDQMWPAGVRGDKVGILLDKVNQMWLPVVRGDTIGMLFDKVDQMWPTGVRDNKIRILFDQVDQMWLAGIRGEQNWDPA